MSGGTSPSGQRRPDRAAFGIALGLAVFGGVLIWDAAGIPPAAGYAGVGPGDMPRLVGAVLIVLALLTAVKAWRGADAPVPKQHLGPIGWIMGGMAAQLVLLHVIGFSLATSILFAATAAAFGRRNLLLTLPVGVALAFVVYGVFDRLLQLNLPAGVPETLIYGG